MKKSILILYTGGTIGMEKTSAGYTPKSGLLSELMSKDPIFQHADMPHYEILEYQPLIDSSNMTLKHWNVLAKDLAKAYDHYDGFLILHGTDTMAYTASALSFLLENLNKPVILTGAQVSLVQAHSDARENLIAALLLASRYDLPEVTIFFNHQLFRGNRARKIDAEGYQAFQSPNFPALAKVGSQLQAKTRLFRAQTKLPLTPYAFKERAIASFHFFPGASLKVLETLLALPLQALLLHSYGSGNLPIDDPHLLTMLRKAIQNKTIIANCTQCLKGSVQMSHYATGQALQKIGVISAADMTPEAAIVKLQFLCSLSNDPLWISQQYGLNLRGERSD